MHPGRPYKPAFAEAGRVVDVLRQEPLSMPIADVQSKSRADLGDRFVCAALSSDPRLVFTKGRGAACATPRKVRERVAVRLSGP